MNINISNFKLVDVIGSSPLTWKFKAVVTVTTKKWFFSKPDVKNREVFKSYGGSWYFIDTGEYIDNRSVDNLARKLEAEKGCDLQYCLDK